MTTSLPFLHSISAPEDIRAFSFAELDDLSNEMRRHIIDVLSQTGGHLSSNLGIIELSIALHYVFSSPKDKFIFDVGHQTYPHKLLTGRNTEAFTHIRHDEGLSGFSHPGESPHDLFFSGHAGNALSLALGMAKARGDREEHILPILGDASLSCGLTLEALNNIPSDLANFVVILNDNNMSISENVGAMSREISQWLHHPRVHNVSHTLRKWLKKIPSFGGYLAKQGVRLSKNVASLFCPNPLFEQFGLAYVGPVDGHNIKKLIGLLQKVKNLSFPVLVHVCTIKGKGLHVAQDNPSKYHGVKANFSTQAEDRHLPTVPPNPTYPNVFGDVICQLGEKYPTLQVVTPAMSLGSCLEKFKEQFPNRFTDVGIAEGHAVTFSAGIAKTGTPVICSIYSTFLNRALDNVFHDVCMQGLPVLFAIDRAGLAYGDGCSHHGIYDLSFLQAMPGLVIAQPRNKRVFEQLLHACWSWNTPAVIRYPNITALQTDHLPEDTHTERQPGKAEILSQGEDLLIIALGHMCFSALEIKLKLLAYSVSATVVDIVFVKPLDKNLLSILLMTHTKVVIIEEHSVCGGLGSALQTFFSSYHFHVDVLHFGVPDILFFHGDTKTLTRKVGLDVESMLHRILTHFHFHATRHLHSAKECPKC